MNAPNQSSRFTQHVRDLKRKTLEANRKDIVKKTFTVDSPIPYDIKELVNLLDEDDKRKGVGVKGGEVKGEWEGKLTRFISRLETKIEDKRYGFLYQPPSETLKYDWLSEIAANILSTSGKKPGIKIIDFSEVPTDVLPIVTGTIARLFYNIQFWTDRDDRTPISFICDEAHLYLPLKENTDVVERQALETFERIAKEGRKYGVSIVVVSQRPSDVSKTILSQCNNFVVLRLTNENDQSAVRSLMPDSLVGLITMLPLLDIGEAIILGDSILLPARIRLDKPTIAPSSATRNFWTEWAKNSREEASIKKAVETLRSQSRLVELFCMTLVLFLHL